MDNSLNNSDYNLLKEAEENMRHNGKLNMSESIIEEFEIEDKNNSLLNKLKEKNKLWRRENNSLWNKFNQEKLEIHNNYKKEVENKNLELAKLKSIQWKNESQHNLIKEAINNVREIFNDVISEDIYLRIKNLPEKDLNPNEWILVKTFELISPFSKENKNIKIENSKLRDEIKLQNKKIESLIQELDHYQGFLKDKDSDIKRFNLNYNNQKQNLENELNRGYEEIKILNEKVLSYDKLNKDYKILLDEKEILERKINLLSPNNNEFPDKFQTDNDLKRKNKILNSEKEMIIRENIKLQEKDKKNEEKIIKLEEEIIESKTEIKKYINEFLNIKNNQNFSYEKKINEDLQSLKDKHNQEIQMTKNNLKEIYEKQISYLNDNKTDLESKLNLCQISLKEKQTLLDSYIIEIKNSSNKFNNDYYDLKYNIKVKTQENEKLFIENAELKEEINIFKKDMDLLKDKNCTIKSEYYKLEADSKNNLVEIKAQLEVCKSQLKNYESMEKEIDTAILNADSSNPYNLVNNLVQLPTSKQKRIEQSVHLVKQLQVKQNELNTYIKENEILKNSVMEREEELLMVKDLLQKSKLPSGYLIETIELKDKEIIGLKHKLNKEIKEKDYLQANFKNLEDVYQENIKKIEDMKLKSENIDNMKEKLFSMINKGNSYDYTIKHSNYWKDKPTKENNIETKPNWYNKLKYK